MTTTTAREEFLRLSAEYLELDKHLKDNKTALDKANTMLQDAVSSLGQYDQLDSVIAKTRANALKRGDDPRQLPTELKEQVDKRAEAQLEYEQATLTRESLDSEIKALQSQIERLNKKRIPAAGAVLRESVNDLAQELIAINRRGWEIRQVLSALRDVVIGGGVESYHVGASALMQEAMGAYGEESLPGNYSLGTFVTEQWKAKLNALLTRGEVDIEIVRPVRNADLTWQDGRPYLKF